MGIGTENPELEEWLNGFKIVAEAQVLPTIVYASTDPESFAYDFRGIKYKPPSVNMVFSITELEAESLKMPLTHYVAQYVFNTLVVPTQNPNYSAVLCFSRPDLIPHPVMDGLVSFYIRASYTAHSA